jgi:hypothetical protein
MSMMEKKLRGAYDDSKDRREPSMPGAMKKGEMMMKKATKKKAGKKK